MEGNNKNFFAPKSNVDGDYQPNGQRYNGHNGHNPTIVGIEEQMRMGFYSPFPQPPEPPKISIVHPNGNWVSADMYPGENGEQVPTTQPSKMPKANSRDSDWLDDAPMPPPEDAYRYPQSSSNGSPCEPGLKHDPCASAPRTPFTPQKEDNSMNPTPEPHRMDPPRSQEMAPLTPNQTDIQNLERLNLNQTPGDEQGDEEESTHFVSEREKLPIDPLEATLIEVRSALETVIQKEVFDPNEIRMWCDVNYYVLKEKIESFQTSVDSFVIDNSIQKSESRFGLTSDKPLDGNAFLCRNQMAEGIRLTRQNGCVWLEVLTACPIFVVCPFNNMLNGEEKGSICRYMKDKTYDENRQMCEPDPIVFKIFDDSVYEKEKEKLWAKGGLDECAEHLPPLCCTRISFVKGFGGRYPRQFVSQCYCWIEIRMMEQMNELDTLCRQHAHDEDRECDSRS